MLVNAWMNTRMKWEARSKRIAKDEWHSRFSPYLLHFSPFHSLSHSLLLTLSSLLPGHEGGSLKINKTTTFMNKKAEWTASSLRLGNLIRQIYCWCVPCACSLGFFHWIRPHVPIVEFRRMPASIRIVSLNDSFKNSNYNLIARFAANNRSEAMHRDGIGKASNRNRRRRQCAR